MHALRTRPRKRTGPLAKNRVDEQVPMPGLDQQGGMIDPRDEDRAIKGGGLGRLGMKLNASRPRSRRASAAPFQDIEPSAVDMKTGIKKSSAVTMVREGKTFGGSHRR